MCVRVFLPNSTNKENRCRGFVHHNKTTKEAFVSPNMSLHKEPMFTTPHTSQILFTISRRQHVVRPIHLPVPFQTASQHFTTALPPPYAVMCNRKDDNSGDPDDDEAWS